MIFAKEAARKGEELTCVGITGKITNLIPSK